MTDDIKVKEFLDTGLQKYPEARAALDAFDEAVQRKLQSVFSAALPTGEWKFVGTARLSKGANYLSVWTEILHPKNGKAWLSAGLWWDRKLTPVTCVYFAEIANSNDVPLSFDYVFKVEDVLMAKGEDGEFLYRPAKTVETLESDLKVLIEARLAQPNRAKG
jgi:hypothetical protein